MFSITRILLVLAIISFAYGEYFFSARRGRFSEVNFRKSYTINEGDCVALVTAYDYPEHCSQPAGLEVSVRDSLDGEVWVAPRLHLAIVRRHVATVSSAAGRCLGQAAYNISLTCPGPDDKPERASGADE